MTYTALELKKELMYHLFWRLHCPVVIDEHDFMDVLAIRRSGYVVEFEIKVSKADLMREIKLTMCDEVRKYSKDWAKWEKHAHYLKREIKQSSNFLNVPNWVLPKYFIPSEFYFYVPASLATVAKVAVKHTPYGVVAIGDQEIRPDYKRYSPYEVIVPAKKLHIEKADSLLYRKLAHGLTMRNRLLKP
jgi:hypothetical protein